MNNVIKRKAKGVLSMALFAVVFANSAIANDTAGMGANAAVDSCALEFISNARFISSGCKVFASDSDNLAGINIYADRFISLSKKASSFTEAKHIRELEEVKGRLQNAEQLLAKAQKDVASSERVIQALRSENAVLMMKSAAAEGDTDLVEITFNRVDGDRVYFTDGGSEHHVRVGSNIPGTDWIVVEASAAKGIRLKNTGSGLSVLSEIGATEGL